MVAAAAASRLRSDSIHQLVLDQEGQDGKNNCSGKRSIAAGGIHASSAIRAISRCHGLAQFTDYKAAGDRRQKGGAALAPPRVGLAASRLPVSWQRRQSCC
jgi:hypothetical protein